MVAYSSILGIWRWFFECSQLDYNTSWIPSCPISPGDLDIFLS